MVTTDDLYVSDLLRELDANVRSRRARQSDFEAAQLRVGEVARQLIAAAVPKAEVARRAGLPTSTLSDLITKAAAQPGADSFQRVAVLPAGDRAAFARSRGGVRRVVAAFDSADVLFATRLHPKSFQQDDRVSVPNVAIEMRSGDWVQLDPARANVGYSGSGPSNVQDALCELGVDVEDADRIAHTRFTDYDGVAQQFAAESDRWPVVGLDIPFCLPHGQLIVAIDAGDVFASQDRFLASQDRFELGEAATYGGFYPVAAEESALQAWLTELNDPTVPWTRGDRRATVYLRERFAIRDGYALAAYQAKNRRPMVCPLVIEQGDVQLWIAIAEPEDPTVQLAPETYEILELADLVPGDIAAMRGRDAQSRFRRWIRAQTTTEGSMREFVEIGGSLSR